MCMEIRAEDAAFNGANATPMLVPARQRT